MKIYPKLNSLKQKLQKKTITNYRGIVFNNDESLLHAMGTIDGKVVFKSGLEMTIYQYRGQVKDYSKCSANLYRIDNKEEVFLQILRTVAFENLLELHPYIKFLKTMNFADSEIYINNTAIAQHYELKTPYLDLTSSFDVASFFATCEFDSDIGEYKPYTKLENLGVIYVYNEMANFSDKELKFEYLGWQGLPRPEEQKGSIFHLKYNDDFNTLSGVKKYYFRHSISTSRKIWNQFKQGKALFPNDSAADLANECKKLSSFTKDEIQIAKLRLKEWTKEELSNDELINFIDKFKLNIIDKPLLNWSSLVDLEESYWRNKIEEVLKRTRTRMSYYV